MDADVGLFTRAYVGAWWVITADEGRTFGLLADYWAPARDAYCRGGFTLGLAGWGEITEWTDGKGRTRRGWRALLHRPVMRVNAAGPHAVIPRFAKAGWGGLTPDGKEAGRWERGLPYRGDRNVDLVGPAHGMDGYDTGDLAEHLAAFGLPALSVPAAVPVDPSGAEELLAVAVAVHQLAVALDRVGGLWLTSREEQLDGRAYLGLGNVISPGTIATAALRRAGITPPLVKFATPDDSALDRWRMAQHGGWVTSDVRGVIV
jgi:hypothetical protein